jgi:adenylate cyclase
MRDFLRELKRRRVYGVTVAYIVVAWVLLQVAATVLPIYDTPGWMLKAFTTLLFLGFPVAVILAWAYDLTSKGVVRTGPVEGLKSDPSSPDSQALTGPQATTDDSIELPSGPSIAVLPFQNLSGDPAQDLFAQSLGGDIISGLTQSSHLFVLAAGATAGMEEPGQDIVEAGKKLGVSFLLQGSVRKAGETLRISAQLLDTSNGVQHWSQNYDRQLSAESLFAVQDDIREQIVATLSDLHGVIYSAQSEKNVHRPTSSLNAYECLSVALAYDKYLSEENHLRARESLERAIEIDPEFDEAWSHLSWVYTDEWVWEFNPLPDSMTRALDAARHAIQLAPKNYHSHWLLSRVYYFMQDRERFLASSKRALELNSSDGTTLGLIGMYTAFSGEWDRGAEMINKAKLLNPNYPEYYHVALGSAEFARADYSAALQELQKASIVDFHLLQILLTATYAMLGREAEAAQHLEKLRQLLDKLTPDRAREFINKTYPFVPDYVETVVDGLRKAGLE